jgi:hypothetical protein
MPNLKDVVMFTLEISLSSSALASIKAHVGKNLPDVKSSHRCEAIGRGLGFHTYASALALAGGDTPPIVRVDGAAFTSYLAAHGFAVSGSALYRAAAGAALATIAEAHPILTIWGIGSGQPRRTPSGRWETVEETVAKFRQSRADLVAEGAISPFLASLAFLANVPMTKTIRRGTGSYFIKHIAENYPCTYPNGEELGPQYVPNGALIAAAIQAGFRYKTYIDERGYHDVNVSFNMSKPTIVDLDCEFRPDGARAQQRRNKLEARSYGFGMRI